MNNLDWAQKILDLLVEAQERGDFDDEDDDFTYDERDPESGLSFGIADNAVHIYTNTNVFKAVVSLRHN